MKKTIYILLVLLSYTAYSQSFSVFNVDASKFQTIKANFFAFDDAGKQITNLNPSDFEVKENGILRTVKNVSCPKLTPTVALSSVLVIDISSWMRGTGLYLAKYGAIAWCDMLPLGKSECAVTSFNNNNYKNQDFTINKTKLLNAINSLNFVDCTGSDFDAAMINQMAGGILIAKSGKYKRIIILLSDGEPSYTPNTALIISQAKLNNIEINCITIGEATPQCMKDFANQTGGLCYGNIKTKEEVADCYRKIFINAQGGNPCEIEWQNETMCTAEKHEIDVKLLPLGINSFTSFLPKNDELAKLEFTPTFLQFNNAIPGIKKDTTITITALNTDFKVTKVTSSNPAFTIAPTSFSLLSGQKQNLTVSYIPADSGYSKTKFTFENNNCPTMYYVSGGFPGIKPKIKTLKLIRPNGGEALVVGMDTIISWEGGVPNEKVKIEYTTNNGVNWILIDDSSTSLNYKWLVPKTPSSQCLMRVTTKETVNSKYPEVKICNQIWMGCNLNVDTYRDGTPIPQVTDFMEWINLKTGAWCYYNNDPEMGKIYGKLYNWYAVNDTRGLAPEGWHIPSDAEWYELEKCLGGSQAAGGKLKSTGTIEAGDGLWLSPNVGATNETGFSGLPGGAGYGLFSAIGSFGIWWSTTANNILTAHGRNLYYNGSVISRQWFNNENGLSVRCIKD